MSLLLELFASGTAVPVTALIIETSYLTNIAHMPLVFAHKIFCQCDPHFEMAAILANFLCGSPVYIVKFRAFIFGSVMHLHWG